MKRKLFKTTVNHTSFDTSSTRKKLSLRCTSILRAILSLLQARFKHCDPLSPNVTLWPGNRLWWLFMSKVEFSWRHSTRQLGEIRKMRNYCHLPSADNITRRQHFFTLAVSGLIQSWSWWCMFFAWSSQSPYEAHKSEMNLKLTALLQHKDGRNSSNDPKRIKGEEWWPGIRRWGTILMYGPRHTTDSQLTVWALYIIGSLRTPDIFLSFLSPSRATITHQEVSMCRCKVACVFTWVSYNIHRWRCCRAKAQCAQNSFLTFDMMWQKKNCGAHYNHTFFTISMLSLEITSDIRKVKIGLVQRHPSAHTTHTRQSSKSESSKTDLSAAYWLHVAAGNSLCTIHSSRYVNIKSGLERGLWIIRGPTLLDSLPRFNSTLLRVQQLPINLLFCLLELFDQIRQYKHRNIDKKYRQISRKSSVKLFALNFHFL